MRKIFISILLLSICNLTHAKTEVTARIIYDADHNKLRAIVMNSTNAEEKRLCEEYVRSENGLNALKSISNNKKGKVDIFFICNLKLIKSN